MLPLRPPFFHTSAALAHLDSLPSHDVVTWTDGSVRFFLPKGFFANYSLCGTEATLSFSADPVCCSFSAKACAILQALRWSRLHQQFCHFSPLLLLLLSSPPSFLLLQTLPDLVGIVFALPFTIRLQWVPRHSFLPSNDAADELIRQGALLLSFVVAFSLSPLTSRIHSFHGLEAYCLI